MRCWGANVVGQVGNGTTSSLAPAPTLVSGITTAVAVTAGGAHNCALLIDGTVRCWGENSSGQLGNNRQTNSSTPVVVRGLTNVVAISAGKGTHVRCSPIALPDAGV